MGGERGFDPGDDDPALWGLALMAEGGADRLAGEADLLGLGPPQVAKALRGQIAVLRLPRRQGRDL